MPQAQGYSVTITAVDQATATINRVNNSISGMTRRMREVAGRVIAPVARIGTALNRLGQVTGINAAAQATARLGVASVQAAGRLAAFVPGLAALSGALTVVGVTRFMSDWANAGSTLGNTAARIGIASDRLHSMQGAATLAGSSADAMSAGLVTLQDNFQNAAGGRAPELVQLMNLMGISFQGVGLNALDASKKLPAIIDGIKAIKNPSLQARVATQYFGASAEALLPVIRLGSKAFADLQEKAVRFGVTTPAGVEGANNLRQAFASVTLATDGLKNAIAERLGPVLGPLLNQFAEWIAKNRLIVAGKLGEWAERLGRAVEGIDWSVVEGGIGRFAKGVDEVLNNMRDMLGIAKEVFGFFQRMKGSTDEQNDRAEAMRRSLRSGRTIEEEMARANSTPGEANRAHGWTPQAQDTAAAAAEAARPGVFGQIWQGIRGLLPGGGGAAAGPGPVGEIQRSPYANNNPTNLEYRAGQRGVMGNNGRWGRYADATSGAAAGLDQMLLDQDRGFNTIRKEISRRSPANENDTAGMVRDIANFAGMNPDTPYDLRQGSQGTALLSAIIRRENGRIPDPAMIGQAWRRSMGVDPAVPGGAPASPSAGGVNVPAPSAAGAGPSVPIPQAQDNRRQAAAAPAPQGTVTVRIEQRNIDPNLRATADVDGVGLRVGGGRVERAMRFPQ